MQAFQKSNLLCSLKNLNLKYNQLFLNNFSNKAAYGITVASLSLSHAHHATHYMSNTLVK
jgi:hypothetical protein